MNFYIGQIFENEYPVEAAIWCNENECTIIQEDNNTFKIEESPTIIETSDNKFVSPVEMVEMKNQVKQNKQDNETILNMLDELTKSVNMLYNKLE